MMKLVVNSKDAGRVVQGVLSEDLKRLEGIWADAGFMGLRFIEAERICVIGDRSVIAEYKGTRLRIKPQRLFIRAVSPDGRRLGAVTDAMIDRTTLMVKGLMLTRGYFEYLAGGSKAVFNFRHDAENHRVVISPDENDWEV
jgi:uncharacterized protein YrrD